MVLFVEDEPLIQMNTEDALRVGGFDVVLANNGTDAIRQLDQSVRDISGLITDVRMGTGPDGWEVARHARSLNPKLPVVYTTADGALAWASRGVPKSILIQKPYAEAQIVTAISDLLNIYD